MAKPYATRTRRLAYSDIYVNKATGAASNKDKLNGSGSCMDLA